MTTRWIALLGRCDRPTDAVEDYCTYLGAALEELGVQLALERLGWDVSGWAGVLGELRQRAERWRGQWVIVQYTALAWSARGFPGRFLDVLKILGQGGARVAVAYHDVEPYEGRRVIDRIRRASQLRTMRRAMEAAQLGILTVPAEKLSWMTGRLAAKSLFVPVGANLPLPSCTRGPAAPSESGRTVAVFGVTGGGAGQREVAETVAALSFAARHVRPLRLVVLGRETEKFENAFRAGLAGSGVAVDVLGVRPGEEVVRILERADALLFSRSPISSRRSSAIAGIACGLPVIARKGSETAAPVTEAGVAFYTRGERDEPGATLVRVLSDDVYRESLAAESRRAYERHFSWTAIARNYLRALGKDPEPWF